MAPVSTGSPKVSAHLELTNAPYFHFHPQRVDLLIPCLAATSLS